MGEEHHEDLSFRRHWLRPDGTEFASAAARWMHLTDTKARPEIIAVCDTNPDLMAWFQTHVPLGAADHHRLPRTARQSGCGRDLLRRPPRPACKFYTDILKAGKHLLGEKPFGMDREQNRAIMAELAEHPDLIVRCSSEMPYFPAPRR